MTQSISLSRTMESRWGFRGIPQSDKVNLGLRILTLGFNVGTIILAHIVTLEKELTMRNLRWAVAAVRVVFMLVPLNGE